MKANEKMKLNWNWFSVILLLGTVLLFYNRVIYELLDHLTHNEDFSYGLIIPLVSAYVIYQKWPLLEKINKRPSWWGLIIIIGGLSLCTIGEVAADLYVPRISLVVTLGGVVVLLGGWEFLRFFLFPLGLLLLMIPLPNLVTKALTLPLQLISSELATKFLQLIGIPVFRQGNIIDLGVNQMQIVDACSGLRYILALLALGAIFCYFYQRKPWKILILLLVLLPATIFANAIRVAAMGLYPILLVGFWHAFSGWLIFLFCFGILAAVNYTLNLLNPPKEEKFSDSFLKQSEEKTRLEAQTNYWARPLAGVLIILLFIPIYQRVSFAPDIPLKEGFEKFPMLIGSWKGKHVHIDPEMVAVTQSSAYLNAEFSNQEKGSVSLWIVYYESQKKAGAFVHSPKGCFVASGWQIEQSHVIEIEQGKPVNWMVVDRMGQKLLIYYWFLQRGRWIADETKNKYYMAYDGLLRDRTDGALVRLITPIDGKLENAQKRLSSFAIDLIPILTNFIPD